MCRPLAYSMLADLIHHVRAELNYKQIRKTIVVYAANLLDSSLSSSIQTMSAKLLLNMIDRIMKLPSQANSRQVLMLILNCFTQKIATLNALKDSGLSTTPDFRTLLRERGIQTGLPASESDFDAMKGLSH